MWTAAKPTVAPWAGEHSTWAFRYGIRAAAEAHAAFLTGQRRFPRFKSRHRDRARFTVADGLRLEAGRVRLAKYGWVKITAPCRAQADLRRLVRRGRARLLNITVTRHSAGRWYATVCFEREIRTPVERRMAPAGPVVGVDRSVKVSAVVATADRTVVAELAGIRALRDARRRVAHLQRDFSRTQKGSVNRAKAAARLARAHARVAAVRADALHTSTARLARTYGVVVVEDLATKNMLRNRHLAAAIGDQGWGELARQLASSPARQLAYKTVRHGGLLIVADRRFATSKTCSRCGWVKPKLSLATWGEAQLAGLIPVGDRHPGGPVSRHLPACLWREQRASSNAGGSSRRTRNQSATRPRDVSTGLPRDRGTYRQA